LRIRSPLISVKGNPHLLSRPAVAVVRARNASANGVRFARRLGSQLTEGGFVLISGLARGIDAAAHQGARSDGTAAVLTGGVDVVYPPENEKLYADIVTSGVVISEVPPGTAPLAQHFPRRNRLVSGAALGVVVVEAAARSARRSPPV
jgi:DNA processing protein